jgi:hypothetical protein
MKYIITIIVLAAAMSGCASTSAQRPSAPQEYAPQTSVDFQVFYDELSPYGRWVEYPSYGYVWMPDREPGFSPYETAGHWVFTDDGWTWISDYPWGWAPFHYGRWDYDNVYGWFWVPDTEWGPAWVSWRRSPGYYGWAPLRPGVSINVALGRDYHERNERWIFVRDGDFVRSDVGRYYIDRSNNVTIINNSTVIVNTQKDRRRNATYITGPDRDDIQRVTHSPITPVIVRDDNRPGHRLTNGELQIYRPEVRKRGGNERNPAPSRVIKLNEVPPVIDGTPGSRQRDVNPPNRTRQEQPPTPGNVNPPNTGRQEQPPTPANVNPSNTGRQSQPPKPVETTPPANDRQRQRPRPGDVNPSNTGRQDLPPSPANVNPPNTGRQEQPPKPVETTPPANDRQRQQPRPGDVNPSNTGRQDLPPTPANVNPSNTGRHDLPPSPANVNPSNTGRQSQPPKPPEAVPSTPRRRDQQSKQRDVNPNARGKEKKPQIAAPPKKVPEVPAPRPSSEEENKKKREREE